jgi:thiosulfate/3-mercaptopyruvate sulfurtransferase
LEVWEKVLVESSFLLEQHGGLSCTFCHQGDRESAEKDMAHEGIVPNPSDGDSPACVGCHEGIVQRHAASAHGTQQGYFTSFERRTGLDESSPELMDMFNSACAECHTSCGQCHISRPASVEGGFLNGHEVRLTPNSNLNCMACHGSRVGDEFRGVNQGIPADTHYLAAMNCMACHDADELHGDGTTPETRYDVADSPTCVDAGCHSYLGKGAAQNQYHTEHHLENVACQVCHSVSYKNCYHCHVGEGLQMPSRMDFRIGLNPRQDSRRPWTYVLLRHIPISPESYSDWGISTPHFSSYPTWVYTSPHNIRRNTPQTATCEACHEDPNLYLTPAYVDSLVAEGTMVQEEIEANEAVVIEELPEWE